MPSVSEEAIQIRREIINMAWRSGSVHVGTALSCVDILTSLYFSVLRLDPWGERDIAILSKGHGAMALYATLAAKGIIDPALLKTYHLDKGALPAHLDRESARGIETSAGALGHGFNVGLGMALGFVRKREARRVFAVIGDGEMQEGSIWEGAMFAPTWGLKNFTVIIDYNNLQGYGRSQELCQMEPVAAKWQAFGWDVLEVDGHDIDALTKALKAPSDKPKAIVAKTIKGRGVSFMEDELKWHYFRVTDALREQALGELQ